MGKIVAAHGIRGAVKVHSYAESAQSYIDQEHLLLIDPSGREHRHTVLWAKAHRNSVRLALEAVTTRTAAEALAGFEIWIPKESLPPLQDDDTYYWFDLIGMAVYDTDRGYLGQLDEIIETGANDVYVVRTPRDFPVKEILLPAISSVVIDIDLPEKRMTVTLPEGLV